MDIFEEKLQFTYQINQKILNLIAEIDLFKGKWSILEDENTSFLNELRNIATIQSIGSSTRIEGATLSDEEIQTLISNLKIDHLATRDEQEVVGYYDALELIFENFQSIHFTENYIKQLYGILLKYSSKDERHGGSCKTLTNKVVATYPGGEQRVIFNTTEPHLVSAEMKSVVEWTNRRLSDRNIHPLMAIGLFIYEFLSIHPFHDGNGRLSRLLTTLLLLKQDYNFIKYVSFERLIEERKKDYYAALMECQQHRNSNQEIIDIWMIFFLMSLRSLTGKLEAKVKDVKLKNKPYLNARQKKIIRFIAEYEPCKVGDVHTGFPQLSINTLKKDLQYLVEISALQKQGQLKGTTYRVQLATRV